MIRHLGIVVAAISISACASVPVPPPQVHWQEPASAEASQSLSVAEAYRANLSLCQHGAGGCRLDLIASEDRILVSAALLPSEEIAPRRAVQVRPPTVVANRPAATTVQPWRPSCAENGSCYGDRNYATGRPKTVHVSGYYRRDGTYVRGHYRSAPRRR